MEGKNDHRSLLARKATPTIALEEEQNKSHYACAGDSHITMLQLAHHAFSERETEVVHVDIIAFTQMYHSTLVRALWLLKAKKNVRKLQNLTSHIQSRAKNRRSRVQHATHNLQAGIPSFSIHNLRQGRHSNHAREERYNLAGML